MLININYDLIIIPLQKHVSRMMNVYLCKLPLGEVGQYGIKSPVVLTDIYFMVFSIITLIVNV